MLAKLDHHRSRHHERLYAMYTKPRGNNVFLVLVRPRSTSVCSHREPDGVQFCNRCKGLEIVDPIGPSS